MGVAGAVVPRPSSGVDMSAPERNGKPGYPVSPLARGYGNVTALETARIAVICGSDRQVSPVSCPSGQRRTAGLKSQAGSLLMTPSVSPSRPSQAVITAL